MNVHVQQTSCSATTAHTPARSHPHSTVTGTYLTVESWTARTVTTIIWEVAPEDAGKYDRVVVYEDALSSHTWLQSWNSWLEAESPPAGAVDLVTGGGPDDWCALTPYVYDRRGPFYSAAVLAQGLELSGGAWFYTATQGQSAAAAAGAAAAASGGGSAALVLAEVGVFQVCLFLQAAAAPTQCVPAECVRVEVYQPDGDYLEVERYNIVEPITIR
jgi:hypothetical protein